MNRPAWFPLYIAALAGVALWTLVSVATGRQEAWDSPLYWMAAYPAALVSCGGLAYRYPRRPVLTALVLFEAQFVAMGVRSGEIGNLWPLGLILFAVLAVPGLVVAKVAASLSRHRHGAGSG